MARVKWTGGEKRGRKPRALAPAATPATTQGAKVSKTPAQKNKDKTSKPDGAYSGSSGGNSSAKRKSSRIRNKQKDGEDANKDNDEDVSDDSNDPDDEDPLNPESNRLQDRNFFYTVERPRTPITHPDGTRPTRNNAIVLDPQDWSSESKPWNIDIWPPPSAHTLLTITDRSTRAKGNTPPSCLGETCFGPAENLDVCDSNVEDGKMLPACDHTFADWVKKAEGLPAQEWDNRFKLKQTKDRGVGLFARRTLRAGRVIGWYAGKLIPHDNESGYCYQVELGPKKALKKAQKTKQAQAQKDAQAENPFTMRKGYIDGKDHGSIMRFVNHSCDPNAFFDYHRVGDHLIIAVVVNEKQDIVTNSEITAHYGRDYFKDFECKCGKKNCSSKKAGIQKNDKGADRETEVPGPQPTDTETAANTGDELPPSGPSNTGTDPSRPRPMTTESGITTTGPTTTRAPTTTPFQNLTATLGPEQPSQPVLLNPSIEIPNTDPTYQVQRLMNHLESIKASFVNIEGVEIGADGRLRLVLRPVGGDGGNIPDDGDNDGGEDGAREGRPFGSRGHDGTAGLDDVGQARNGDDVAGRDHPDREELPAAPFTVAARPPKRKRKVMDSGEPEGEGGPRKRGRPRKNEGRD